MVVSFEVDSPEVTREVPNRTPIAPLWHTGILVLLFVCVAATSALRPGGAPNATEHAAKIRELYLPTIAMQLGFLLYVSWPRATLLRGLKAGFRGSRFFAELGAGLVLYAGVTAVKLLPFFRESAGTDAILPRSHLEKLVWVAVALASGFCEELVFRGYLQRQATAFTGRPWLAILFQAVLFGGLHGYQGVPSMIFIAMFGVALGAVARVSGSLRTGIYCHCFTDLIALMFT
jgi:membrane protease YdiL (CAAX protease family)